MNKHKTINRMSYSEVQRVLLDYASEVAPLFADKFERFPQGYHAATIVNYLNDHSETYRKIAPEITELMINAAVEIITREKTYY